MEDNIYTPQVTVNPPSGKKAVFFIIILFLIGAFFLLPAFIVGFHSVVVVTGLVIGCVVSVPLVLFLVRQRIKNSTMIKKEVYKKAVNSGLSVWFLSLLGVLMANGLYYRLDLRSNLNENFMLSFSMIIGVVLITLSLLALIILIKKDTFIKGKDSSF